MKIYTPLRSSSPKTATTLVAQESPIVAPLQIDEGITVVTESETPFPTATSSSSPGIQKNDRAEKTPIEPVNFDSNEVPCDQTNSNSALASANPTDLSLAETSTNQANPDLNATPTVTMGDSAPDIGRELLEEFISPGTSHVLSPHFSQYMPATTHIELSQLMGIEQSDQTDTEQSNLGPDLQVSTRTDVLSGTTRSSININRREILTLTSVLERIPQEYAVGEEVGFDQPLTLTVVDEVEPPLLTAISSQEGVETNAPTDIVSRDLQEENSSRRGKRRRPKYSLTSAMLKKHPVLKFSATGPLDKDKTPHKWWCRVCKVELSLMSRGILELVSHYRSESHLIKEHRMRMETPGLALYDKEEGEILGASLQDAKRKAKEMYPIAPQLDIRRPLVGQETVPDFSVMTPHRENFVSNKHPRTRITTWGTCQQPNWHLR